MSRINKEMYDRMHASHVFGYIQPREYYNPAKTQLNNTVKPEPPPKMPEIHKPKTELNRVKYKNVKPIKIELNEQDYPSTRRDVYKPFINKQKQKDKAEDYKVDKVDIIRHRYHYPSDIFFLKSMPISLKRQLKEEAFPKKKKFISNYNPDKYLKCPNSFDNKMHELYEEKGDKFTANKKREKGKPKKVQISSKGYAEYLEKFNNENYSKFLEMNKNHNRNHKETEKFIFNKEDKFHPNTSAHINYDNEFESDIFNIKNKDYQKFIKKNKKEKLNNSVDYSILRSRKVRGNCQWPADLNWTKNSELIFKTHIKNMQRNKSMSSYDRYHADSVKNIIENIDEKDYENRKIKRNRSDLGIRRSDLKRPLFDKKKFTINRARKLSNNCSFLDDEKTYKNNIDIRGAKKNFDMKEYVIGNPGDIDVFEFSKLLKIKGIHLIDINEKTNIIENEDKNKKDRVIKFKIRENNLDKFRNEQQLKKIEKILQKKNSYIQIKPETEKKRFGLKSCDFYEKHRFWRY